MLDPTAPDYENTPVSPKRPRYGYGPEDAAAAAANPFVTIITPFYNAADLFAPTAESVMRQSFQQWEWLIVDDGSTDADSLRILDEYEQSDPRIRVIHQDNAGPSAARNRAIAEARTDFIAQIDADDLLEATAIEKWLWFLLSYPEYGFVKGFAVGFQAENYLWTMGFHTPKGFFSANLVQPNCMLRRSVHAEVGGYDEDNREGFEDWDFWMRCATHGHWGGMVPEYLDWYRRREDHGDRWSNWDGGDKQERFRQQLKERFPELWKSGMPRIQSAGPGPFDAANEVIPCENRHAKGAKRALMLFPWMTMGGSDRFGLDVVRKLTERGWEVSIATTLHGENLWQHVFESHTPDVFVLERFLRPVDYPRFLAYLIRSRRIDTVLVSHSMLGYMLLPYLRHHCPDTSFVDYNHIDEDYWLNGGYPRFGVGNQGFLDLNIVSSQHLRSWMVERGGDPEAIAVCYTSIDPDEWQRDDVARASWREKLGISPDTKVILYPARLCDQKQPRVFAKTLERVRKQGHDFVALSAGDGEHRDWLERFVRSKGLENQIRLLGRLSGDDVRTAMSAADIMFLPSQWEGIALSVFEAMASSVVVVGADVGGQIELVTPECGYMITRGTEDEEVERYSEVLGICLRSDVDLAAMGRAAAERIRSGFTLQAMIERMEELFERARQRHDTIPSPRISRQYARETATLALEHVRITQLADKLWKTREEHLGLHKTWRTSMVDFAYRVALRTPPRFQGVLKKVYHRLNRP